MGVVEDGDHDLQGMEDAIKKCQAVKDKPSMIKLRTTIGFGSLLQGTGGVHGSALKRRLTGDLPEGWEKNLPVYSPSDAAVASRKLSEIVLTKIHQAIPELVGGSADLTGSNLTRWKDAVDFQPPSLEIGDWSGRYIRYGVREHAMGAIMNGLAAYGTVIPYGGTFLNFVSYAAGAVRLLPCLKSVSFG